MGALCYCMGIHEAAWPSERLEVMGDSVGRRYDSVATMRHPAAADLPTARRPGLTALRKEHPEWVLGLE